ncbi:MAG: lactate racemase domain-containing protein [Gammaproteobacteria bacterium]|nr:lactate racemase domain-containing protein [Gammaproteobacteria bacterium]
MIQDVEIPIAGGLEVPLPRMVTVRQAFDGSCLEDVPGAVRTQIMQAEVAARIKPGMRVAIGAGSRGVANIGAVVKATVAALRELGAEPFVFPAMGSHGGASVEGQTAVLAGYDITESLIGAPVRASMDTVVLGELADGTPIHMDKQAHAADGVVLINRIKPHTTFRGPIESGIIKMMAIGMGKIAGATTLHAHGMDIFPELLPRVADFIMQRANILFGIGLIENAYDHTALVEAVLPEQLTARETALLAIAKSRMGRICFSDIDVLVIDQMGKEISGAGFDPNISGRNSRGVTGFDDPRVQKIVVLDLSAKSKGNATGLGLADVITRRLYEKIDYPSTYANVITSAYLDGALIPIPMRTDRDAISLAVKTLVRVKTGQARIVRIRDTLSLERISVSEPMLDEVHAGPNMEVVGELAPFAFDAAGGLAPIA